MYFSHFLTVLSTLLINLNHIIPRARSLWYTLYCHAPKLFIEMVSPFKVPGSNKPQRQFVTPYLYPSFK